MNRGEATRCRNIALWAVTIDTSKMSILFARELVRTAVLKPPNGRATDARAGRVKVSQCGLATIRNCWSVSTAIVRKRRGKATTASLGGPVDVWGIPDGKLLATILLFRVATNVESEISTRRRLDRTQPQLWFRRLSL